MACGGRRYLVVIMASSSKVYDYVLLFSWAEITIHKYFSFVRCIYYVKNSENQKITQLAVYGVGRCRHLIVVYRRYFSYFVFFPLSILAILLNFQNRKICKGSRLFWVAFGFK